jgi:leader peptidase (prepilin peptidase) / N-methyltransferase
VIGSLAYAGFFSLFAALGRSQSKDVNLRGPGCYAACAAGWFAEVFTARGASLAAVSHAALFAFVAVAAMTDLYTGYVFDAVTIPAGAVLLLARGFEGALGSGITGAMLGSVPLALLYAMTRGRGLGFGDVKLAGAIGIGLGADGTLLGVGAAFVAGALWGVAALACGAARRQAVPFAPFLGLGATFSIWMEGGARWLIG